ncbi:MAG: hypothetical protein K2N78_07660 [Oscillospiraceae bacterium]|nr:hypothetical protein [Oscillospiraceae bacterium]
MDTWEILNNIYGPMFQRVQVLGRKMAIAGYTAKWSWYNLHATRRGDEYKVELFPIPVISVGKWCDVILELDSICVDAHFTNEQAKAIRWKRVIWPFELYGVADYTVDLYSPGMSKDELPERIAQYGGEIGAAFAMPRDCTDDEILEIVNACREWDTHNGSPT